MFLLMFWLYSCIGVSDLLQSYLSPELFLMCGFSECKVFPNTYNSVIVETCIFIEGLLFFRSYLSAGNLDVKRTDKNLRLHSSERGIEKKKVKIYQ